MTFGMQNVVEANQCIVVYGAIPCQSTSVLINTTDTEHVVHLLEAPFRFEIKLLVSVTAILVCRCLDLSERCSS